MCLSPHRQFDLLTLFVWLSLEDFFHVIFIVAFVIALVCGGNASSSHESDHEVLDQGLALTLRLKVKHNMLQLLTALLCSLEHLSGLKLGILDVSYGIQHGLPSAKPWLRRNLEPVCSAEARQLSAKLLHRRRVDQFPKSRQFCSVKVIQITNLVSPYVL